METELINLDDGTVQVIVRGDGYEEIGQVSGHHLVADKERQLIQEIYRRAEEDFLKAHNTAICDI